MDTDSVRKIGFNQLLDELLEQNRVSDAEYIDNILPYIPENRLWDAELAEEEIRHYLERGRKR